MTLEFEAVARLGAFRYEASLDARGEVVVLFGHSGAGKSVTLQFAAGLMKPERGRIVIDGRVVFDAGRGVNLPPQERAVGYVVQDLALFPHMTVAENVAFGMGTRRAARSKRVADLLALLGMEGYERRRPATLSGGQQQRVALARALGRDARVLLLDEPFSALDESLRRNLRRELLRLRAELGLTILFVTHDLREAHYLADRLAVFDEGRVLQFGLREDVFRRPASRRVGELTGVANILRGTVVGPDGDCVIVDVAGVRLRCGPVADAPRAPGAPVEVLMRAERVNLRRDRGAERAGNLVDAVLREESAYGATHTLHFDPVGPGPALDVEIAARPYDVMGVASRREWTLELPSEDLHVVAAG